MAVRKSGFRKQSGKEGWVVDYRDLSGKRRQRTFETKREANAFEERVRAEKRAGTHVPDRASGTVGAAAESMLRAMREIPVAPATLSWYASIVKLHIMPFLGDQIIARMTPVSVHLWLDELRAGGRSRNTVRIARQALVSILDDAVRTGRAATNHARTARLPRESRRSKMADGDSRKVVIPEPAVVQRISAVSDGTQIGAMIKIAAVCGLRWGEIRALRWCDVKADTIEVRQAVDRFNRIGPPKTAAAIRSVPLPASVASAIAALAPKKPAAAGGLVFLCRGRTVPQRRIMAWLTPVFETAGVPWFKPHSFRHFAVSLWRARGVDWHAISKWIGHTNVSFTIDTYSHLFREDENRQADKARIDEAAGEILAPELSPTADDAGLASTTVH